MTDRITSSKPADEQQIIDTNDKLWNIFINVAGNLAGRVVDLEENMAATKNDLAATNDKLATLKKELEDFENKLRIMVSKE